jgi:hypothetical protein
MTPKTQTNFRIDNALLDGLQKVNEREPDGVSFHVRRAIREYLGRKGVKIETERKRPASRKRS